jgi:hypothetical protein
MLKISRAEAEDSVEAHNFASLPGMAESVDEVVGMVSPE